MTDSASSSSDLAWNAFEQKQKDRGIDLDWARAELKSLAIETPSWGYGDSGTRFKVFQKQGVPRDPFEKFQDAGIVHELTGLAPSVAVHIPWDKVEDYDKLKSHAESHNVRIGAVNPNVFQDDDYMLGSTTNADEKVRQRATDHMKECVEIMRATGSDILSLWFADGTNYPGQADLRQRKRWMEEALSAVYKTMDSNHRMLIEYKFFEPAFYHTDIADWGMALNFARKLGPQAEVLVDTGHHAQGTNVEHIVAFLLDEGELGGFHFNSRKYADDDLIVGSINPYELFLIFYNILAAKLDCTDTKVQQTAEKIAYMIDQSHNIEPKIPAMIRSVLNCQTQYAKALLINWDELAEAQEVQDVLAAEAAVREAYEQDVEPLIHAIREEQGLPIDPMKAFLESGYQEKIAERGVGGASW
jgi:L-rhamnose isomerase/sugar isomerase